MKKDTAILSILLIVSLLLSASNAFAARKIYVTDSINVDVRSGPGNSYRILAYVRSGEHLQLLGDRKLTDKDYHKVKTSKGVEGYILTRFLLEEPVAKDQLAVAVKEIDQLKTSLATTRQERDELSGVVERLQKELMESNELFNAENRELKSQVESLSKTNKQLVSGSQQKYLLYGGSLVLAGMFAGLILPSLRRRKKSNSW